MKIELHNYTKNRKLKLFINILTKLTKNGDISFDKSPHLYIRTLIFYCAFKASAPPTISNISLVMAA
jgi:hypothetical protein